MRARRRLVLLLLVPLLVAGVARAQTVEGLDPHLTAKEGTAGRIVVEWQAMPGATGFTVQRREGPGSVWTTVATLAAGATSWEDAASEPGRAFEYHVAAAGAGVTGHGYAFGGLDVPAQEEPGAALIVTDPQSALDLAGKLERLAGDLEAEGWAVHRATVDQTASPPTVKSAIEEIHAVTGGRLRAVLLLGEVPRAFSGFIRPDAHPDHEGAWPADGYFADLAGSWTDAQDLGGQGVFVNRPGDGKFDQSVYPAPLTIAVGRVDTADLPAFAPATPQELLGRYLDANHAWRTGTLRLERRTLVVDSFGYFFGEAFARLAWRDGSAAFASAPTAGGNFFDRLEEQGGYALAFGCGGGSPTSAGGVGSTSDFVSRAPKAAFMGLFGSYFGDWSYSNNFLRASLVSPGAVLGAAWFARPYLHLHGLGALQTFGEAFLASANNPGTVATGYDAGFMARGVHQALLGDPTLRLFVTRPPSALTATATPGANELSWSASPDATHGYHVYRSAAELGEAELRLTAAPIAQTEFRDTILVPDVTFRYRVVAVERLTTGSGTFFNHSRGPIAQAKAIAVPPAPPPDAGTEPPVVVPPPDEAAGCGCGAGAGGALPLALLALVAVSRRRRRSR